MGKIRGQSRISRVEGTLRAGSEPQTEGGQQRFVIDGGCIAEGAGVAAESLGGGGH